MLFFKDNFKRLREARGLTHDEIAAACHVSQRMVSRWEKKGKASPRAARIPTLKA